MVTPSYLCPGMKSLWNMLPIFDLGKLDWILCLMGFVDLPPSKNPVGGSPRSPSSGIPVREYQEYSNGNGNGVWKAIATGLGGLVVGLLLAWFTAFQSKGVTTKELQEYVEKYSPYAQQRDVIQQHFTNQDQAIGQLQGKQERLYERMNANEYKITECDRQITELHTDVKTKMDIVATFLEQQKAKR